jgi:endo-1,4-beta-xylanase
MIKKSLFISFLLAGLSFVIYSTSTTKVWAEGTPIHFQAGDSSLKSIAPLPIGVAIGYFPMKYNPVYDSIVSADFDNVTFDNALKNGSVVKPDGSFDYSQADALVQICKTKGINVYGHNLCWYQQVSPYVNTLQGDSIAIEHFLKKYITTTVTRYKNTIHAWDVVNEAINNTGGLRIAGPPRRGTFYWGKYLGSEYIARAFQYAHAANPEATLFYNDYDLETDTAKLNGVINMLNHLIAEKIPINGVGTQMHMSINTPDEGIDHMFQQLASTGLLIRISEMDIKVNPDNDPDFVMTKKLAEEQAAKCRYVLQSFFKWVPAKQRFGITFWDLGTKDSWITFGGHRKGSPCLFDSNYQPKPMYFAVLDFFKNGNK